jgi:breakpoint cluster region protein
MSVFGDFRNVWVQRFPGSDLPAAWEEDVRANLDKHKQKVAVLREELEKEEFYVEYLEQLLIDVAKHKTRATNDEETINDDNDGKSNDRSRPASMQNMGLDECSETNGNNLGDNIHSAETINSDSVNQCISELSLALPDAHSVSRSNSEVPNRKKASEHKRPRCNTHPDISNYVTVIEVNGLNVVKGDGMKEAVDSQGAPSKKVPPLPPPKKFYNKSKSVNDGSLNSIDRYDDAGSQVEDTYDEQNENRSNEMSDEMQDEAAASCPKARSAESIDAAIKLEEHVVQEKCPLEDASSEDGVLPDDEEPYYDSVALDGEYVYLQTGMYLRIVSEWSLNG